MKKYEINQRRTQKKHCGFLKHVLLVSCSFIAGYASATWYDFSKLSQWVHEHVLTTKSTALPPAAVKEAELPKPKFEFYTLLTKDSRPGVVVTTPSPEPKVAQPNVSIEMNTPSVARTESALPTANRDAFVVQLASFRQVKDAERMRAALSMKGFAVNLVEINQQNTLWYRVVLGPFTSRADAQRIQSAVLRSERINGMIRKMDV